MPASLHSYRNLAYGVGVTVIDGATVVAVPTGAIMLLGSGMDQKVNHLCKVAPVPSVDQSI